MNFHEHAKKLYVNILEKTRVLVHDATGQATIEGKKKNKTARESYNWKKKKLLL